MKFAPKTADEIAMEGLLPAGVYPFQVVKAEDAVSKTSGKEMIKLTLEVYGEGNRKVNVFDYILESMADKLFKFCKVVGLEDKYNAGSLEAIDCEGTQGYVGLKIDPAKNGYEPKNVVSYYRKDVDYDAKPHAASGPVSRPVSELDDEIPF